MDDLKERNDLIRRGDAIDLCEMAIDDSWEYDYATDRMFEIPAVDAVEVRHARWIPHPDKEVRDYDCCTWCGTGTKRREYGFNPDGREYVTEYSFRYCPWCGARMDGRREDGDNGKHL